MADDTELLQRFVSTFEVFDDRRIGQVIVTDGDVTSLLGHPWDADGWSEWRPVRADLRPDALQELYARVPGPLPPLYRQLILSYRWAEVDIGRLRLLGNLPPSLRGLAAAITRDHGLFEALARVRTVQFGRGPDVDYDPVCFDLPRRHADGDCPVVKFDHEEILCNRRCVQVEEVAPSFRRLVELVIADASGKARSN